MQRTLTLAFGGFLLMGLAACAGPSDDDERQNASVTSEIRPGMSLFRRSIDPIPNQYIVVMKNNPGFTASALDAQVFQLASSFRAKIGHTYRRALQGFSAKMTEAEAIALSKDPRVEFVEEDGYVYVNATQTGATWGLDRLDQANLPLNQTYTYQVNGSGVHAYIVDTGIMITHSDFGSRASLGYTAINDGKGAADCHGHGTHVAGTIGGATWGVAKGVSLVAVRVLNCQGSGTDSGVIAGVDWVAQNAIHPAVANMSLGGGASTALDNAVQGAINAGVVFALAAGNETQNACNVSPARVPAAITVGATTKTDARASYSNYGTCVDVFAPGSSITSCGISSNTATATMDGTSMASPHVAGVAALYLGAFPNATPAQVSSALTSNATPNVISGVNGSPNKLLYMGFISPTPDQCNGETAQGRCSGNTAIWCASNQVQQQDCAAQGLVCAFDNSINRYGCIQNNPDPCNGETAQGRCSGNTAIWCANNQVQQQDCAAQGLVCGLDSAINRYGCIQNDPGDQIPVIQNGQSVTRLGATTGKWVKYKIQVPSGATNLSISISGGLGDADLYVKIGTPPTSTSYDCRPYRSGNTETCSSSSPTAGWYYIGLNAYRAFSGVTLKASYR